MNKSRQKSSGFKSYENFLLESLEQGNLPRRYRRILERSNKMTTAEANKILDSLDMPKNVRDYIERESNNQYEFKYSASESKFRLVDALPIINESLNEDEHWNSSTEQDRQEFDELMWKGVYEYLTTENINEGFWSSIVGGVKNVLGRGKEALKTAYTLISGIGKVIKGIIDATKAGLGKVIKYGVALGKSMIDGIKSKAEKRAEKLQQHGEEQIQKDQQDLGSTVAWVTGKGVAEGVKDGEKAGAEVGSAAVQGDQDGKQEELEDLQDDLKGKSQKSGEGNKNENAQISKKIHLKESFYILEELQKLEKEELLEMIAVGYAMNVLEGSAAINESLLESKRQELNISEGFWDKVKKLFGGGKDDKDKGAEDKEEEERLNKKDQEKEANTEEPPTPEGNPENKTEDAAKKAEKEAEKGESSGMKIFKKVITIVIQGPVWLVEWLVENGVKKGLKFLSACVNKLGGPGIFLFITVAAAAAVILGLATEVIATLLPEGNVVKDFFHLSGAYGLKVLIKKGIMALSEHAAHAAMPILKWIPVMLGLYFGTIHVMHILHDRKLGKSKNHSEAIEKEEKHIEEETKEIDETDDEELKKLLQEKVDLRQKLIEFHKKMREDKVELINEEKAIKEEKKALDKKIEDTKEPGVISGEIEAIQSFEKEIKKLKAFIDQHEKGGDEYAEKIEKAKEKIEEKEKEIEKRKEKIKKLGGEEVMKQAEELEHREHEFHVKERVMAKQFEKYFDDPNGPHAKIKEIQKKINEIKSKKKEGNESASVGDYQTFLREKESMEEGDILEELKKSYYYENRAWREEKNNETIDKWIVEKLNIQLDEEFYDFYNSIGLNDLKKKVTEPVKENVLFENKTYLKPKLRKLIDDIGRRYSGFKNGRLDKWEDWTWEETLPAEVQDAAKGLGVAFDQIQFFSDRDNPDAYDMFLSNLPAVGTMYKSGEYTNERGLKKRFTVAINI